MKKRYHTKWKKTVILGSVLLMCSSLPVQAQEGRAIESVDQSVEAQVDEQTYSAEDTVNRIEETVSGTEETVSGTEDTVSETEETVQTEPETPAMYSDGWHLIDGSWFYYLNNQPKTGWLKYKNKWYYLDADGKMAIGWRIANGKHYYMDSDGIMQTGWIKQDEIWYYLDASGAMRTGWIKLNNIWYYLHEDGKMAVGWIDVSGVRYYMKANGSMKTGWLQEGEIWYYLGASGAMQKNGWVKYKNDWYYFGDDGHMLTDETVYVGDRTYYIQPDGTLTHGWGQVNNTWYYWDDNGTMCTGWLKVKNVWYYLNHPDNQRFEEHPLGEMQIGWVDIKEDRYYFRASGARATGWIKDTSDGEEKWYYLYETGKMARDAVVDGIYLVDENGVWYDTLDYADVLTQYTYVPYVYGGKDLNGWDCSGFVWWVMVNVYGLDVPYMTTYQLIYYGEEINRNDQTLWKSGDLLCTSGHVAIYLGNGKVIHAANSRRGTVIDDLDYYLRWFAPSGLSVRRVV